MQFKMVTNSTENQFVKVLNQAGQICYKLICNSEQFISSGASINVASRFQSTVMIL